MSIVRPAPAVASALNALEVRVPTLQPAFAMYVQRKILARLVQREDKRETTDVIGSQSDLEGCESHLQQRLEGGGTKTECAGDGDGGSGGRGGGSDTETEVEEALEAEEEEPPEDECIVKPKEVMTSTSELAHRMSMTSASQKNGTLGSTLSDKSIGHFWHAASNWENGGGDPDRGVTTSEVGKSFLVAARDFRVGSWDRDVDPSCNGCTSETAVISEIEQVPPVEPTVPSSSGPLRVRSGLGWRQCVEEGCSTSTRSGGKCSIFAAKLLCTGERCGKFDLSRSKCVGHGGGRRCAIPECSKGAMVGAKCFKHGRSTGALWKGATINVGRRALQESLWHAPVRQTCWFGHPAFERRLWVCSRALRIDPSKRYMAHITRFIFQQPRTALLLKTHCSAAKASYM